MWGYALAYASGLAFAYIVHKASNGGEVTATDRALYIICLSMIVGGALGILVANGEWGYALAYASGLGIAYLTHKASEKWGE